MSPQRRLQLPCISEYETVSGDCALTARGITFGRSGRDAFYGKRQPWWAKLLKKVGLGSFVKR